MGEVRACPENPPDRVWAPAAHEEASFGGALGAVALGVKMVNLQELLQAADFVSVNAPLTNGTRHLLGKTKSCR